MLRHAAVTLELWIGGNRLCISSGLARQNRLQSNGDYVRGGGVATMSSLEAFLLGMMAAWTPSLIVLAWFLWSSSEDQPDEVNRPPVPETPTTR